MDKGVLPIGMLLLIVLSMIPVQAPQSGSAGTSDDDLILLKNIHIYTGDTVSALQVEEVGPLESEYYLIQFTGHVTGDYKSAVETKGTVLYGYIPNNAYLARINVSDYAAVSNLSCVRWIGPYFPGYKTDPDLQSKTGILNVTVVLFEPEDSTGVSGKIEDAGGEITAGHDEIIYIRINSANLSDITSIEEVKWIEETQNYHILNNNATIIMNVTTVRTNYGLNGSGQIVAVADTGLDTGVNDASMHDDLEGRIISIYDPVNGEPSDLNGHGTHVAASVLGNGSCSKGLYAGAAPAAQLVFQAIGSRGDELKITNLSALFLQAYNDSARIHSNSWGSSNYGDYTANAKIVDEFMWKHPDMLIVFAAGNDGNESCTINSPATAKNCISVGASENFHPEINDSADDPSEIVSFSSRGPTDDGRIKPDLVAPGTAVISARSSRANIYSNIIDRNYTYMSGTSMATPLTAGTAALVREYYVENESINPTAALIKATLINGATDLDDSEFVQGWGRVDLNNSLFPDSADFCYYDNISLNTGENWQAQQCFDNASALKISLVWTDYPAEAGAGKTLVNDLDLTIKSPDGTIYLGNGGTHPDTVNNVEQITLEDFESGWYNISVNGTNVPEGPQPFALVVSGSGMDTEPPLSVCDFNSSAGYSWINWTWTHPDETDLDHVLVYVDRVLNGSTGEYYYNATGFLPNTTHTISILTVDGAGNINQSWGNNTATTLSDSEKPVIHSVNHSIPYAGRDMLVSVNVTDNHIVNIVEANNKSLTDQENNIWNGTLTAAAGNRTINISAMDIAGNVNYRLIAYMGLQLPEAKFSSDVTSGNKPLSVRFWDNSSNATRISWDFDGNGEEDSNESSPVWTFADAGNYSVNLTTSNENGSDIYTSYITVTTASTKSSSGGGGGGGAATGEEYDNILTRYSAIQYLEKGKPATYEFTEDDSPVRSIILTSNKNAGQIKILLEILRNTSTLADENPSGQVYSNINIWAGNAAFKESIQSATIVFHVDKTWLSNHNISAKNIGMEMYTDDGWIILDPVSIISDTGDYIVYEVETPKLASPFAIYSTAAQEEKTMPYENQSSGNIQSNSGGSQSVSVQQTDDSPGNSSNGSLSNIGIFPNIALLAGAYCILKYNHKKGI